MQMINKCQFEANFFCNIKFLCIGSYFSGTYDYPICFLQRFYNLETLEVLGCDLVELSPSEGDAGEDKEIIPIRSPVAFEKERSDFQEEYHVHNYSIRPILPLGPKVVQWCPPSILLLKFNVDGAFRIEYRCGAVGFFVRSNRGFVWGGGAHFVREAHSAEFVEAQAVIHELKFASSKGFTKIIIECDAFAVVSRLKCKSPDFAMPGLVLEEAKQLMNSFEYV
ncbi:hypothetical protein F3Y22_tig00000913pilonHSYRG00011 [Hibiscus syriacus]|uniref:RNase H type-1 domain-containing protein n=1 Tax=Hibiscus syriacus TaxID=106335 RepID=A0A6A3D3L0_HIBSY|nr:hypothetical protein F3Y22_tig00000913pilonHSYRG00011 [Hibiscus syriacus]